MSALQSISFFQLNIRRGEHAASECECRDDESQGRHLVKSGLSPKKQRKGTGKEGKRREQLRDEVADGYLR